MKKEVLELLMDSEDFISGEDISRILGVSRTAVWKNINKLKEEGYDIESVTSKGYRILGYPNHFVQNEVQHLLRDVKIIQEVYVLDSVDSTNQEAKRKAMNGVSDALILSEEQTGGKGRRGRGWESPTGVGIFMSLILKPDVLPTKASMLTLVAGVAVKRAIEKIAKLKCHIKWPNDLVLGTKKVCGILTEMSTEMDAIHHVIVGIGINVNNNDFPAEIQEIATSLKKEKGNGINRKQLLKATIYEFEILYQQFIQNQDLEFLLEEYNQSCVNIGKDVKVIGSEEEIIAKGLSITKTGGLQIQLQDGKVIEVQSGEVSVRGLYGYVDE